MKDAVATMGDILPDDVGGRDAVHVAVVAAKAVGKLLPGQNVAIEWVGTEEPNATPFGKHVGIVDPFLKETVQPEQRFWLYLYPRTITGLSHRWSHPDFLDAKSGEAYAPPSQRLVSEQWLRNFCKNANCPDYESVMAAVERHLDGEGWSDEYLHFNGQDAHGDIPPEFWEHVENVLGRKVESRPTYFSCGC